MKQEARIGNILVRAREWRKGNHHRIYFTEVGPRNAGQAIWDVNQKSWIRCKREFGWRMKESIKQEWGL